MCVCVFVCVRVCVCVCVPLCCEVTGAESKTAGAPVRTGCDTAVQPDKGRKQRIRCGHARHFFLGNVPRTRASAPWPAI